MKRSEMVDRIQLSLETQSRETTGYRIRAYNVLEMLEDAGMVGTYKKYSKLHDAKLTEYGWEDEKK